MSANVVLSLLPLQLLQYGLHMALLNAPMDYMGCNGVEERGQDCIANWGPGFASSSYALGGLLGSVLAGVISTQLGSKLKTNITIFRGSAFLFAFGALSLCFARSQTVVVIGRLATGSAAGMSVVCCPILINKLSDPNRRGLFGSLSQISINIGIILAQVMGLIWASEKSWRYIMYGSLFFALLGLFVAEYVARIDLSETPQSSETDQDLGAHPEPGNASLVSFMTKHKYRFTLLCTISIFVVQQITGINSIIQYGVRVMSLAVPNHAKLVNLVLSLVNLGMTLVGASLIDRCGRKKLLLVSLSLTGVGTTALSFGLVRGLGFFSILAVLLTIAAFAIGIGPIPFLYISEISPSEAVGIAQSVGTTASWLATFAVVAVFPAVQQHFGASSFYLFGSLTLASTLVYAWWLPNK